MNIATISINYDIFNYPLAKFVRLAHFLNSMLLSQEDKTQMFHGPYRL